MFVFFSVQPYLPIRLAIPILLVFFFFLALRPYLSIRLLIILHSTVSIDPSLYRVVRYLFSSLYVSFLFLFAFFFLLLLLPMILLLPSPLWSWNRYLIWFVLLGRNEDPCVCGIRYGTVACYCYSFRFRPFVFFFPPSSYSIICTYYYWNLYYYPPPLFIVFDLYHKTNNRDHPTRIDSSLYRIDPSLFIGRMVSFFLSLRAVPILFVFFFFFVLLLLWLLLLPSLLWSWNRYLIWFGRTSLAGWPSYNKYPSLF